MFLTLPLSLFKHTFHCFFCFHLFSNPFPNLCVCVCGAWIASCVTNFWQFSQPWNVQCMNTCYCKKIKNEKLLLLLGFHFWFILRQSSSLLCLRMLLTNFIINLLLPSGMVLHSFLSCSLYCPFLFYWGVAAKHCRIPELFPFSFWIPYSSHLGFIVLDFEWWLQVCVTDLHCSTCFFLPWRLGNAFSFLPLYCSWELTIHGEKLPPQQWARPICNNYLLHCSPCIDNQKVVCASTICGYTKCQTLIFYSVKCNAPQQRRMHR